MTAKPQKDTSETAAPAEGRAKRRSRVLRRSRSNSSNDSVGSSNSRRSSAIPRRFRRRRRIGVAPTATEESANEEKANTRKQPKSPTSLDEFFTTQSLRSQEDVDEEGEEISQCQSAREMFDLPPPPAPAPRPTKSAYYRQLLTQPTLEKDPSLEEALLEQGRNVNSESAKRLLKLSKVQTFRSPEEEEKRRRMAAQEAVEREKQQLAKKQLQEQLVEQQHPRSYFQFRIPDRADAIMDPTLTPATSSDVEDFLWSLAAACGAVPEDDAENSGPNHLLRSNQELKSTPRASARKKSKQQDQNVSLPPPKKTLKASGFYR